MSSPCSHAAGVASPPQGDRDAAGERHSCSAATASAELRCGSSAAPSTARALSPQLNNNNQNYSSLLASDDASPSRGGCDAAIKRRSSWTSWTPWTSWTTWASGTPWASRATWTSLRQGGPPEAAPVDRGWSRPSLEARSQGCAGKARSLASIVQDSAGGGRRYEPSRESELG